MSRVIVFTVIPCIYVADEAEIIHIIRVMSCHIALLVHGWTVGEISILSSGWAGRQAELVDGGSPLVPVLH